MFDRSPIRTLALKLFQQRFGDLFSVRAEIAEFERSLIEGTYELMWLRNYPELDYRGWERTVRAAFHFLDRGFLFEDRKLAGTFLISANRIVPTLHKSFLKRRETERASGDNEDIQIERYLAYYKTMYEGLLPVIMAPVVFAFSVINHIKDRSFIPRNDGRISLKAIQKMERWLVYTDNRLAIGLNGHIRNAYSHETYRILDGGEVELWDTSPFDPKKKWGPEIWTLDSLRNLCNDLWFNSLAVVCAFAIFTINNRRLIIDRGWADSASLPPLRRDEFQRVAEAFANYLSFNVEGFERSNNTLRIRLSTRPKGIDQDEEIFFGGDNWARRFKVRVNYVKVRVIEQVLCFLQRLRVYLNGIHEVLVSVQDPEGQSLGEALIDVDSLDKLEGPTKEPIEAAIKRFKLDSLGDSIMFVKIEAPPKEV